MNGIRKRDILHRYRVIVGVLIWIAGRLPRSFQTGALRVVRNWDSYVAILLRYVILKNLCHSCGDNVAVFAGVFLLSPENLEVGNNVSIHPMCYIDASGGISIGHDVSIAHGSTILSTEHRYLDKTTPIKDQGYIALPTVIEDDVWIGAGARILAGAVLEKGCIVAAGAVVKWRIAARSVVGGVPAKLIKER